MNIEKSLTSKGEKRRQAIIEAALQLFTEQGFENTSLDMVIALAGGSKRMIYSEFGGKEGLLQAVLADCTDLLTEPLRHVNLSDQPIDQALEDIGVALVTNLLAPERVSFYRMLIRESQRFPDMGLAFLKLGPATSYQLLGLYLDRQVKNGTLALANPTEAATTFIEMCKGDWLLKALFDPAFTVDKAKIRRGVKKCVALFLDGCRC